MFLASDASIPAPPNRYRRCCPLHFSAESLALAKKHHSKAEAELDRAVSAYLAGAVDTNLYKREQERLQSEIRRAEVEISRPRRPTTSTCSSSRPPSNAFAPPTAPGGRRPYVKRLLNAQVLKRVEINGGELVSVELKPPFHGLSCSVQIRSVWSGARVCEPGPSRSRNLRGLVHGFAAREKIATENSFVPPADRASRASST
jgi:hypothetical protein